MMARVRDLDGEEIRHVLIKQLVCRRAGVVVLRQFNPEAILEVPNEQVAAVRGVMSWDEALGFLMQASARG